MMKLDAPEQVATLASAFADALAARGFAGDYERDLGAREVASTDNSIYQVRPLAIAYPRSAADVQRIAAAAHALGGKVSLSARGGNTGTNGQSLNNGVIVDFGRHMNRILSITPTPTGAAVLVEPGVVLDQLNATLAAHGLFFPPMVSTASRATIGGMVATDASGKGSRIYGKTSDYLAAMDIVLADGTEWAVTPLNRAAVAKIAQGTDRIAAIHREALRVAEENDAEIEAVFPKINRGLTGYNLQRLWDAQADRFFLAPLLAGSEGTLALTAAITVNAIPTPRTRALALIRYDSFDAGLRDVQRLLKSDPLAVEILDDKILSVAQEDVLWAQIGEVIGPAPATRPVHAMTYVEFAGEPDQVRGGLDRLSSLANDGPEAIVDWKIVTDPKAIGQLWSLREKSVGLLARLGGGKQGMPFVEDTAVPPERLADYVAEFRALLDGHGLSYGMFGHADVGCLHVRPFLDMKDPAQADLIRPISDRVAALAKSYGGLLWGEHGRGFRGEYSPFFFGPTLYAELRRIKAAFDPRNILNPGKLAAPDAGATIDRIDAVPMRGAFDRQISPALLEEFDRSVACNGNGACYSWDALNAMCPSYKASRDRAQSPKGRAALLRGWARAESIGSAEREELAEATAASLSTCLSCKACTTLCPVKVDVPTMKSRFLADYYRTRKRPARHRLLAQMERLLGVARRMPRTTNAVTHSGLAAPVLARAGFVDLPAVEPARRSQLPAIATPDVLAALSPAERERAIILVEDSFTATFDGALVERTSALLKGLGFTVFRLPPRPNGKALHVVGLRKPFAKIAQARVAEQGALAGFGVPLVGLDAATALMNEQEYREFAPNDLRIEGLETFLQRAIGKGLCGAPRPRQDGIYTLLGHCTEQALRPETLATWVRILAHFGIEAQAKRTGCCGMAGMFGHEIEHQAMSRRLFELSWSDAVAGGGDAVLVTGFSCRSQVKRLAGFRPRHPAELLHALL
ncbi:FAD-binding and (Fe-S)-binding domain-containing protein [Sphingomonas aracearum]|uniref:D-2-hydroxyglutarate dehydrogenase n=1 Tax=Sphingomonas aracearum TaxID=2283317 RepID=A0A369W5K3_9SPHN|nr:FAD-binding and (Fe-S)-binding domain-containing protein [Sphingomonas aracearum]RDE07361.1 FAD-binding oxidoreductase [Sphingomonas aracearum]